MKKKRGNVPEAILIFFFYFWGASFLFCAESPVPKKLFSQKKTYTIATMQHFQTTWGRHVRPTLT